MLKTKNLEDLLEAKLARTVFLRHRSALGFSEQLEVREIKRFIALSPRTYILLYKVYDEGQTHLIRGNASVASSRRRGFEAIEFLLKNGFAIGNFLVPHPIAFDEEYNLILYPNIEGAILINELTSDIGILRKKINLCAQWLSKLHTIVPPVNFSPYGFQIKTKSLQRYYRQLSDDKEKIVSAALKQIQSERKVFLHGDFQPNNIIFNGRKIAVFDFNDAAVGNPMIDVASFLTQLRTMILRFSDPNLAKLLEDEFLKTYQNRAILDEKLQQDLNVYEKIFLLKILSSLSDSLSDNDPNKKNILERIYQYWQHGT